MAVGAMRFLDLSESRIGGKSSTFLNTHRFHTLPNARKISYFALTAKFNKKTQLIYNQFIFSYLSCLQTSNYILRNNNFLG